MKLLRCALVAGLALGVTTVAHAQGQGRGRGQGQEQGRGEGRGNPDGRGNADGRGASDTAPSRPAKANVVFAPRDVTLIRTHYGNRFKNLPPGLQKKLARGGTLPPGWEKKIEALPASLERDLVVLGPGQRRGIYDGHAVIYDPITHAILDIVSLF